MLFRSGLAAKITTSVNNAAKISVASPGTLVALAGAENYTGNAKNNTLYEQMQRIQSRIDQLTTSYEKERQRYWNQFNSMESILSNYNAQSTMLTQYFG